MFLRSILVVIACIWVGAVLFNFILPDLWIKEWWGFPFVATYVFSTLYAVYWALEDR